MVSAGRAGRCRSGDAALRQQAPVPLATGARRVGGASRTQAQACNAAGFVEGHAAEHTDGYKYSRFCDLYRGREGRLPVTMRQTHLGGAKLFINMPATRSANFVEFLISCGLWASARVIAYTIRMNNFPLIRTEFFVVQRRSLAVIDAWYLSF